MRILSTWIATAATTSLSYRPRMSVTPSSTALSRDLLSQRLVETEQPVDSETSTTWLRILQINDVYELDNFASLHSLIQAYSGNPASTEPKHRVPDKTIVVCCGDFCAPSLLSSLDKGFAMVDLLQRVGVDYVCLGNHETDISMDALKQRVEQKTCDESKQMVWVNSNMRDLNAILGMEDNPKRQPFRSRT